MFQKEALSALIAKLRESGTYGQTDMQLLRETCMNAATFSDLTGKIKLIACFDGSASDEAAAMKAERGALMNRLGYNLSAVTAMAAYYNTEPIFTGDPQSSDIAAFCAEFTASLLQTKFKSE